MKAILAVNNLNFIGLNGGIPWKCKEDFQHFKRLTLQSEQEQPILLAGWNTYIHLPELKGRVVICDRRDFSLENSKVMIDWCIGGKKTYEKYCHLFTELHISHIDDNTIGDCLFPDFANLNKDCKIINYHFKVN